ncbi:hypothetical protein CALVIDRAFT_389984 [Calocera viscosa TUFC12733]|uniref:Adhesin domain-containing protein n=1 Tax=Calocera viscosa (strain TUFC12733) TaxID=1330018 RepID=A0A167GI97_CALVF|nr:hypothetical protein CALVIDRAFT_389984 [Calocera viscosa TUFC12733]
MPPIYLPDLHVPVQHLPIAFTNTSTISFTYTADLSVLFLRSLGRQASGVVTFSDGGKGSRNIIEIIIHHGAKPQDLLEICTVRDHNDPEQKQGLTIEVLDEAGWTEHVASLDISVKLGRTNDGKRPALETLMENFSHEIEPFRDDLVFPYVDFATSHGRIHSSKLRADRASIETLNGAISGSLNITDTLNLRTISGAIDVQAVASSGNFSSDNGNIRGHVVSSHQLQVSSTNGPIDMHIELINKEGSVPTRAVLSAVNNHIEAKFSLTALDHAGKPASGGAFEINGETTNGFLYLDVVDQPHLANLTLEARSLNDGATVKLNPAFEGRYAVRSIPFSHSHVENNNHYRDNKVRRFERYEGRHIVHGSAEWHSEYDEEISHGQGLISIESVRAPNRLLL